jgi:hypothetical protein
MKLTRKMICAIAAGATLCAAAPVFADSWHGRGYEHRDSYRGHDRRDYREHDRYGSRDYGRRHVVVVERPYVVQRAYVVQQPMYYNPPMQSYGPAAIIGAAIGGYIDSQQ